jgi:hypothetical protein
MYQKHQTVLDKSSKLNSTPNITGQVKRSVTLLEFCNFINRSRSALRVAGRQVYLNQVYFASVVSNKLCKLWLSEVKTKVESYSGAEKVQCVFWFERKWLHLRVDVRQFLRLGFPDRWMWPVACNLLATPFNGPHAYVLLPLRIHKG